MNRESNVVALQRPQAKKSAQAYARRIVPVFAPLFGITDIDVIKRVAMAVGHFDECCRHIDTLTDNTKDAKLAHDAVIAFSTGVTIASTLTTDPRFYQVLGRYVSEASEAERHLLRRKHSTAGFSEEDLAAMGRKNAIIKTAPALFAAISNKWDDLAAIELAVNHTACAVQMIDDLLDRREDMHEGNETYPIVLARAVVGCGHKEIFDALYRHPKVAIGVLNVVADHLRDARSILDRVKSHACDSFFETTLRSIDDALYFVRYGETGNFEIQLRRTICPELMYSEISDNPSDDDSDEDDSEE